MEISLQLTWLHLLSSENVHLRTVLYIYIYIIHIHIYIYKALECEWKQDSYVTADTDNSYVALPLQQSTGLISEIR